MTTTPTKAVDAADPGPRRHYLQRSFGLLLDFICSPLLVQDPNLNLFIAGDLYQISMPGGSALNIVGSAQWKVANGAFKDQAMTFETLDEMSQKLSWSREQMSHFINRLMARINNLPAQPHPPVNV